MKEKQFNRFELKILSKKGHYEAEISSVKFPFPYILEGHETIILRLFDGSEFVDEWELCLAKPKSEK